MSDHEYQDDFSEYASSSDEPYEIISRGSAYSHSDEEEEHEEAELLSSQPEKAVPLLEDEHDRYVNIVQDESSEVENEQDVENGSSTVHYRPLDKYDGRSGLEEETLGAQGTSSNILAGSYVEAGNMESSEELEVDADQQLSTPTLVPSLSVVEDTGEKEDRHCILFDESPVTQESGVTMGVHTLEMPSFTTAYRPIKLTMKMPLAKDKLTLNRPFRLLYCGLPEHQQRVIDKVAQALSLSSTGTSVETFLEVHGCKAFIEIYTTQTSTKELCILSTKDDEMVGSHRVDHPTMLLHDDDIQITKYWMPDLAIVLQEELSFSSALFDAAKIKNQNVPVIELWTNKFDDVRRNQPYDGDALHLVVQHDNAPAEDSPLDAEATKILHSPKKVGLDICTFEDLDATQLNRHLAFLQEKAEEYHSSGGTEHQQSMIYQQLQMITSILSIIRKTLEIYVRRGASRLKLVGQAAKKSVFPQSILPSEQWRWLAKWTVSFLCGLALVALCSVLSPMRVGMTRNVAALTPSVATSMVMTSTGVAFSAVEGIRTEAPVTVVETNAVSATREPEQACTDAAREPSLGKSITDIITGHKLADSAVAEWFDFRAQKMLSPKGKHDKHAKGCRKSHEGRLTNWTLKAKEDSFIVTTNNKTTWRHKLQAPSIVAANGQGQCRVVDLTPVESRTYSLEINPTELDGSGVVVLGDALDDAYLLQRHMIKKLDLSLKDLQSPANLTERAIHVMKRLQSEKLGLAPAMSQIFHELQDAASGVRSQVHKLLDKTKTSVESQREHIRTSGTTNEWVSSFHDWSQNYLKSMPHARGKQQQRDKPDMATSIVHEHPRIAAEEIQRDAVRAVKKASEQARKVSSQLQGAGHRMQKAIGGSFDRAVGACDWLVGRR